MTTNTQPQPIEALKQMVAPGQEDVFEQFLQEMEGQPALESADETPAQMPPDPGGKYEGKSREEIIEMHRQAERLIGSRQQAEPPAPTDGAAPPAIAPTDYTPEMGLELYGQTVGQAINAAGINPLEMAAKVEQGADVSAYVDALVEKGNLPRELVTTYLEGVAPKAGGQAAAGLSDADAEQIKAAIGGDAEFERISSWATENLQPADLAEYNRVVDEGNKDAISAWLRLLRQSATATKPEPALIGGGSAAGADRFESDRDAINARAALNSRGQNRYDTEPAYRKWFEAALARSNVFQ
jgi:hypothetical protein